MYGQYAVTATGYLRDIYGNQYQGGGTYHFWIANRLTIATATFQGMSYPTGSTYGRDIAVSPPVPATFSVTATLYPNSDFHAGADAHVWRHGDQGRNLRNVAREQDAGSIDAG
jgi:hypothetical protein